MANSYEPDEIVCVHPNLLHKIGKRTNPEAKMQAQMKNSIGAAGAAGYGRQRDRAIREDPRDMKLRMEYQSKINCLPNSLTLQFEPDKKRSKS